MIRVLETMELNKTTNVLVCEYFQDETITSKLMSNVENYSDFEVETPRACFATPKTRNIILKSNNSVKEIKFVNFI